MLAAGTSLGPYQILTPLGAGGMGEVYRARDTRLGRDVAIKVIPAELARDPERIKRFEQEARAAGALNHPGVCTILDLGTHEGSPFVVMELLEGESLRSRLEAGPIPARKAIEYAAQAARGLAAAHEKGIVHRDLKPENLFLTKDGRVKVLDFGLAKLTRPEVLAPAGGKPISILATETGAILGTVGYMAPEQVRGQEADARSDLFALGAILYELLTGRRAFHGASYVETLHAILNEEPAPLAASGREIPPGLEPLVRRCLEKNPVERFQSASDLAFALEAVGGATPGGGMEPRAARPTAGRRERLAWIVAVATAAVAATAIVAPRWGPHLPTPTVARFAVTSSPGMSVVSDGPTAVISPDGRRLVFTASDSTGKLRLWLRALEALPARPLSGTDGALFPFWSPDSRFVAFFADGKLQKVPADGGSPEVICDAANGRGGSWNRDGVIVFAPVALGPLLRVSAEGGPAGEVARADPSRHEVGLRFPCFLPDGKHFLYVALPRVRGDFDVYVGSLDSKERRRVMSAGSAPVYAEPGYLLFGRGGRLVAQRFDRSTLRPMGKAVPLDDALPASSSEGAPVLGPPTGSVLALVTATVPDTRLTWFDASGRPGATVALPAGRYEYPVLSPDNRRAVVTKLSTPTGGDLWVVDLQRDVPTRLTFDGSVTTGQGAVWSPDGKRIAFQYNVAGPYDIYEVISDGTGRPEPLLRSDVEFKYPAAFSADGRYLAFSQMTEETGVDLWLLPLQGERAPVPYLRTPFNEVTADISPDGRWLAYCSDETGTAEIYVRSFPEPGEKHRVSASGGTDVKWSADGRQLLFSGSGTFPFFVGGPMHSVDVQTTPSFRAGNPRVLFTARQDLAGITATSDFKRFLAAVPVEGATPPGITVVMNWQDVLKR